MLTRTPAPDQMVLWVTSDSAPDPLTAPAVLTGMDPAGMEQPSMFEPIADPAPVPVTVVEDRPFEPCDECGLDIWQLHCEDCGSCYCDGECPEE